MTTHETIVTYIASVSLVGIFIVCGIALYLSYAKTDEYLRYFTKSPSIYFQAPSKHDSLLVRLLFMGTMTASVTFPNLYIKSGQLNADDFANIPHSTRRTFRTLQWANLTLAGNLMLGFLADKSGLLSHLG